MSQSRLVGMFVGGKILLYLIFHIWKVFYPLVVKDATLCTFNNIIQYFIFLLLPVVVFYYIAKPPTPTITGLGYWTNVHNSILAGLLGHLFFIVAVATRVPLIYATGCEYGASLWIIVYVFSFAGVIAFIKECGHVCECIIKGDPGTGLKLSDYY